MENAEWLHYLGSHWPHLHQEKEGRRKGEKKSNEWHHNITMHLEARLANTAGRATVKRLMSRNSKETVGFYNPFTILQCLSHTNVSTHFIKSISLIVHNHTNIEYIIMQMFPHITQMSLLNTNNQVKHTLTSITCFESSLKLKSPKQKYGTFSCRWSVILQHITTTCQWECCRAGSVMEQAAWMHQTIIPNNPKLKQKRFWRMFQ